MPRKTLAILRDSATAAYPSMRPRPDAAENRTGNLAERSQERPFNEAAARCRGKPLSRLPSSRAHRCLQ